jgi:cobalt-zinc-cadmium efflux system outer membrane protein
MRHGSGEEIKIEGGRMKLFTAMVCAGAVLCASCVSVPRDAGRNEIARMVGERGGPSVEWSAGGALDDASLATLLSDELTVDEAVALAVRNSPRLQIELAELGIARAEFLEASVISNPLFEFEIRYPGDPYRPYELRLAQSLVDLISLPRRRAAGRVAFEAAQMRVSSAVLRFAGEVRASWFEAVAAAQLAEISRTNADAARTAAEVAIRQHAAENITDLDLENEQALYEQARLDLARAEKRLVLAREALGRILGLRERASELRLPSTFPELPSEERPPEELQQLAAAQRLDLALAQREVEAAQRRVPLARLAALEELVLDYHYEREPSGERTRGPGLEFSIPIFDTGRAARTRAEAEYLRARSSLAAIESESASLLRSANANLAEARARVEYYRDVVVPRRRRIVELTKLEHNAMLVGVFQLLQAKQNALQAERDSIEAQREYWTARLDLDQAVQGISSDSLFTPATEQGEGARDVRRGGH